jgi:hypothetical protein
VNPTFTFMTYGGDSISPPEWKFLLDKLKPASGLTASRTAADAPVLLVSGWLTTGGDGAFNPFYALAGEPVVPGATGEARAEIRLLDAAGRPLAGYPFDLPSEGPEVEALEVHGFQFWLPLADDLDRVQLLHDGAVASERRASAHAPDAAWLAPASGATLAGAVSLTWQAADADGDPLFFLLSYSADGGATWTPLAVNLSDATYVLDADELPGGDDCRVRVLVSDGWHTRAIVGGPFRVARKPPAVAISAPADGEVLSEAQARVFVGWVADAEDGTLGGGALRWSSDHDGPLGTGTVLLVPPGRLSPGAHLVTLSARDGDGLEGGASVGITVRRSIACVGDCAVDGVVTVDELIAMVNIALDQAPAFDCARGDADGDGRIAINELVAAVTRALAGCEE